MVGNRNGVWKHEHGPEENSEGKMGPKPSGDDRGGEHVVVPKRVYITREDLEVFGFTARCPGCVSLLKMSARQAHTENRPPKMKKSWKQCGRE